MVMTLLECMMITAAHKEDNMPAQFLVILNKLRDKQTIHIHQRVISLLSNDISHHIDLMAVLPTVMTRHPPETAAWLAGCHSQTIPNLMSHISALDDFISLNTDQPSNKDEVVVRLSRDPLRNVGQGLDYSPTTNGVRFLMEFPHHVLLERSIYLHADESQKVKPHHILTALPTIKS